MSTDPVVQFRDQGLLASHIALPGVNLPNRFQALPLCEKSQRQPEVIGGLGLGIFPETAQEALPDPLEDLVSPPNLLSNLGRELLHDIPTETLAIELDQLARHDISGIHRTPPLPVDYDGANRCFPAAYAAPR